MFSSFRCVCFGNTNSDWLPFLMTAHSNITYFSSFKKSNKYLWFHFFSNLVGVKIICVASTN